MTDERVGIDIGPWPPCPKCGHDGTWCAKLDVSVRQGFGMLHTHQDGFECEMCGERWSTAEQCAAADDRLVAQGWKPGGVK